MEAMGPPCFVMVGFATESVDNRYRTIHAVPMDVSDHPGLSMIHEIIRDSLGALGQRLRQPAM